MKISMIHPNPQVSELAFQISLSFAATYLCVSGFSAFVCIKAKTQKNSKWNEITLANTKPQIPKIGFAVTKSTVAK